MLGREGLGMRLPNIHLHTRLIAQVFAKNINGQLLAPPGINIPAANFFLDLFPVLNICIHPLYHFT